MATTATPAEPSGSEMSFSLLRDVLQTSNIDEDEEAVMITRMTVDDRHVKEFERILRLFLKNTHKTGHVSTTVVKPPAGEFTYTSIVKYSSLKAMRQIFPSTEENGSEFSKLLAARDSLLVEPPTYQIEAGFGTWIESDGNTRPMRDDADDNLVYHNVPEACCLDSCDNPHGLNVRASFVAPTKSFQLFQPRYQRNNKKGGQKNLRCFPCCRNGRHVSSGFCGDSIRVHVAVSRITEYGGVKICPIATSQPAVLAYARFLNLEGAFDPAVSGPEVFPGQTIQKYELTQYVRDKDHPLNPLFPGILRGAAMESSLQSAIFEFNAECKAWHYGWTAPRGQGLSGSDAQHVLEILFMKPVGTYLFCLERLRSDAFSIYSSRRASHASVKAEAEVYEDDIGQEDDRGQKRKRSLAPVLPTPTASTPVVPAGWPSPSVGKSNQETPLPCGATGNLVKEIHIKQEQTSPLRVPMPPNMFIQNQSIPIGQDQSITAAIDLEGPALPDLNMLSDGPSDLVSHMLFSDTQERRVVASEDLPWSELYNLFDSSMPMVLTGDEGEDESPASSPASSIEVTAVPTTTATTTTTDPFLTYL
ncbi:hypothetical protein Poli38472_009286 [Pythium oligandrum]|uniref:Uncharacterized protein n=1 Tax=Pythium oligandrum TaxID=41045 RepID=A0A8K1CL82_PYTOL|nr:hypothetical protein Poli38472_009286 [Pythium oligandrum]|eukprot:TMW65119.1 hypothetical protein Poli38472_009286 [Pythium oligandrum]